MSIIYIAARIGRKLEMRAVAVWLRSLGHDVTARWIEQEDNDGNTETQRADMDLADVRRSDVLVAFSEERGAFGGGRNVEFGIALERGLQIIVIGPVGEHIFHHASGDLLFFETLDQFVEATASG